MNGLNVSIGLTRFSHLLVPQSIVVSGSDWAEERVISPGTVMGKKDDGKYRPYVEVDTTAATDNASPALALDPDSKTFKFLKVGDKLETAAATLVGTVQTINRETGAVTLTGNSAVDAYEGALRIPAADLSVSVSDIRILGDELEYDDRIGQEDKPVVGYSEGVFLKKDVNITATLASALSLKDWGNEYRL